jgi:hypothetical protein
MKQFVRTSLQKSFIQILNNRIILRAFHRSQAVRTIQAFTALCSVALRDVGLTGAADAASPACHYFYQVVVQFSGLNSLDDLLGI